MSKSKTLLTTNTPPPKPASSKSVGAKATKLFDTPPGTKADASTPTTAGGGKISSRVNIASKQSPQGSSDADEVKALKALLESGPLSKRGAKPQSSTDGGAASDTKSTQPSPVTAESTAAATKQTNAAADVDAAAPASSTASPAASPPKKSSNSGGQSEYAMTREQIVAVENRWLDEAKAAEKRAQEIPIDFDRALGQAIMKAATAKSALKEVIMQWDQKGGGVKKVDFRRYIRGTSVVSLKMTSGSNVDIDKLFDSITGGGGGAVANVKEIHAKLWPYADKANVPDPRAEALLKQAEDLRVEAATVHEVLDALDEADRVDMQLNGQTGDHAPVVAQIGALVLKRNMKVGEVMAKWGDVDHNSFRDNVWALGVVAEASAIDAVFDQIDDDGGGTLDAEELKHGMKLLVDSAKKNNTTSAGLEKKALALHKTAATQIMGLFKKERAREERLRIEAEEAAEAERLRLLAEAEAAALAAKEKAEADEKKRAEKAALLAHVAELKRAAKANPKVQQLALDAKARGETVGEDGDRPKKVSVAAANAEARKKAEAQYEELKKSWAKKKRKWRPPGLMIF